MKELEGLTVDEIEPNYCTVREAPEVDRFSRAHDRISQRDEVTNSGSCPNVLQVRSRWAFRDTIAEVLVLPFGPIDLGVQFVKVLLVELPGDGLVDVRVHGVVPESIVFCRVVENVNFSGADKEILSKPS